MLMEWSANDLYPHMVLSVFQGGGWGSEFVPLGSDPNSAVKLKPYIIRPQLNPIMSVWVGVC